MNKKGITIYIINDLVSIVVTGIILFWSAGRIDWWSAWAVIVMWLVWFAAMDFVMLSFSPALMAERLSPPRGAKSWDRAILSILRLMQLGRYILAGLDQRYGWTGGFPLVAQIAALVVWVMSCALFVWAMANNPYFSAIVRIQADREHAVATGGPYRVVRHPGYVALILIEMAISALLASWWALFAGGLCAVLLILRTVLEDRTLQAELPGYSDYARQVRYRLIPGVW
jgi:protein-S-isoprenylcysteine O-methyltransferase Ste14